MRDREELIELAVWWLAEVAAHEGLGATRSVEAEASDPETQRAVEEVVDEIVRKHEPDAWYLPEGQERRRQEMTEWAKSRSHVVAGRISE